MPLHPPPWHPSTFWCTGKKAAKAIEGREGGCWPWAGLVLNAICFDLVFVLICLLSLSLSDLLFLAFPSLHNKTTFLDRIMYLWFNARSLWPIKYVSVGFIFDVLLDLISVLFLITPVLVGKDRLFMQAFRSFGQTRHLFKFYLCIYLFFYFFLTCVGNFRFLPHMVFPVVFRFKVITKVSIFSF